MGQIKCLLMNDTKIWKVIFNESHSHDLQEDLVHFQLSVKPKAVSWLSVKQKVLSVVRVD